MDILSFVLGIGAVVVIVGVIIAVVSFFRVNKQKRMLEDFQTQYFRDVENERRDREMVVHEIYRTIDSRLDKLENRLKGESHKQ
jgi:uncharacterized membrane protein YqiK